LYSNYFSKYGSRNSKMAQKTWPYSYSILKIMQSNSMVDGLPELKSSIPICDSCVLGKHSKSPYPQDLATHAIEVLALIHMDLNLRFYEHTLPWRCILFSPLHRRLFTIYPCLFFNQEIRNTFHNLSNIKILSKDIPTRIS